jgi:carboxylesterase type B
MTSPRARFFLKVGGSVLAAGAAAALFLLSRPSAPGTDGRAVPGTAAPPVRQETIALVDRQIDSVLARFGIAADAVKKRSYTIPDEKFTRTERLVALPDTIAPVSVNAAVNVLARRHGGRAVAA